MIEWVQAHWMAVAGSIVSVIALGWLPFTRVVLRKGLSVVMSEAFLKELFFDLAGKYVKSTKTKLDDKFLTQLKNSF
jgi:hypothetical protein